VADAQARTAAIALPDGYYLTWGGQFENQQRAMRRLLVVVPLSLAIIFVLLFATFGRIRQAALVILNVPFALVGASRRSGCATHAEPLGVGRVHRPVRRGRAERRRDDRRDQPAPPGGPGLRESVLSGAETRLKPVLMTALVAALGFVPMALSHGAGAEVQRPLATVVIGGVITSTLLTLIVLPTVYEMIERRAARRAD